MTLGENAAFTNYKQSVEELCTLFPAWLSLQLLRFSGAAPCALALEERRIQCVRAQMCLRAIKKET